MRLFERFRQDLRYGARTLRRNPTFTAVSILALAVGSAATASLFSYPAYEGHRDTAAAKLDSLTTRHADRSSRRASGSISSR